MKYIIILISIISCNLLTAQEVVKQLPFSSYDCPIVIVNDSIIGNLSMLEHLSQDAEISIFKTKPTKDKYWYHNLAANGIVLIQQKEAIPHKTISELNDFFALPKKQSLYVNGYLVYYPNAAIAVSCIQEIEMVLPNKVNRLAKKALNVWTITKIQRKKGCGLKGKVKH